jgi:hypothetical protein
MGKKLKIFAFLAVFFAFFLFPTPVKSACYEDAYGNCTGTCDCSKFPSFKCGTCECAFDEYDICQAWYTCHSCVTNTPRPSTNPHHFLRLTHEHASPSSNHSRA